MSDLNYKSLTQQQLRELKTLLQNGERVKFYFKYRDYTGSDQAFELAEIASFSGLSGGAAERANKALESNSKYPKEGVLWFSKQIADNVLKKIEGSYNNGKGGIVSDKEMAFAAQEVWIKLGLGDVSPVNVEVWIEASWPGVQFNFAEAKEAYNAKGFKNGALAGLEQALDLSKKIFTGEKTKYGKTEKDFDLTSGNYETEVTKDMGVFYIKNLDTGEEFTGKTGAIRARENRYVVTGESKEQIALKYNIPLDQITENTATYTIEHYESRTPLAPITTYTITVGTNSKKQLDCSSDVNDINGINRGKKGQETCDANDKFTEGAAVNTIYRQKVFEELEKISGIGNIIGKKINYNFGDEFHEYTVKSGETVWGIATQYGITVDQLVEISGNEFLKESRVKDSKGKDYILIKPDQKINVPAVSDPNNKENDQAPKDVRSNTKIKNALEAFNYATTFISPLVIDLDGDGIELSHVHDNPVFFDIDGDGNLEKIGWVKSDDGHLAMDRNGNGKIDDITELYGDDVIPAFSKLALHDKNEDGVIDEKDSDYDKILVWRDLNQNGVSEPEELKTLRETGIASISLKETKKEEYNQDNLITGTSEFTWFNGTTGEVADVHYVNDKINSWYVGKGSAFTTVAINPEVLSLPNSRGYGTLPSLHIAMSQNNKLLEMVKEFSNLKLEQWNELLPRIESILFEWSNSTRASDNRFASMQNNFGANKIGFLEKFTGQKYKQVGNEDLLGTFAQKELHKAFHFAAHNIKINLLVQGPLKEFFSVKDGKISYKIFKDRLEFDTTKYEIAKLAVDFIESNSENIPPPDLFSILLDVILDERNNIEEKKHFSDKNTSKGLQRNTMNVFELYANVVSNKDIVKIESQPYVKFPVRSFINHDHTNLRSIGDWMYDKERIEKKQDIKKCIEDLLDMYAKISTPTYYHDVLLFKSLLHLNNLLVFDKERTDQMSAEESQLINKAEILTNGSDYIDKDYEARMLMYDDLLVYGRGGDDIIIGRKKAKNILYGEDGNDWLVGGATEDKIHGGHGNDFLIGGDGDDYLYGGSGDDYIEGGEGVDYMDGGDGKDTLSYVGAHNSVNINLATGKAYGGATLKIGHICFGYLPYLYSNGFIPPEGHSFVSYHIDVEDITKYAIWAYTNESKAYIRFNKKTPLLIDDIVENKEIIADIKSSQKQNDSWCEFIGKHEAILNYAIKVNYISQNTDTFLNFENIHGSQYDDILIGDEKDNVINGESGNDHIEGGEGNDFLYGGPGNDTLLGGKGDDILDGGEGADYMDGGEGFDTLNYASFYETEPIYVNLKKGVGRGGHAEGDKFINVEAVRGSRFNDILVGDSGDNVLRGQKGNDILYGNGGYDILLGGKGDNFYIIKSGQKGKTIIPFISLNSKILFVGYSLYDQNIIKSSIFGAHEEWCRLLNPREVYNFTLGSNQELQINGFIKDSSTPAHMRDLLDELSSQDDAWIDANDVAKIVICPRNFEFLDSIESVDLIDLKEYDIFA